MTTSRLMDKWHVGVRSDLIAATATVV